MQETPATEANPSNVLVSQSIDAENNRNSLIYNPPIPQGEGPSNVPSSQFPFANPPIPEGAGGAVNDAAYDSPFQQGAALSNVPKSPFQFANPIIPQAPGGVWNTRAYNPAFQQGAVPEGNVRSTPFAFANPRIPHRVGGPSQYNFPAGQGGPGGPNIPSNTFSVRKSIDALPRPPPFRPIVPGTVTNSHYQYLRLNQAISKGELNTVKTFLDARPDAITATLLDSGETILFMACIGGQVEIAKELLERMTPDQLLLDSGVNHHTVLAVAAINGNMEIAKALVEKNRNLVDMLSLGNLPVVLAVVADQKDMARFLYSLTPLSLLLDNNGFHGTTLLAVAIFTKMLDIALHLFEACPRLAVTINSRGITPISTLAAMPALFPSGYRLGLWQRFLYYCVDVKQTTDFITTPSSNTSGFESSLSQREQSLPGNCLAFLSNFLGVNHVYKLKKMHLQALKLLRGISEEATFLSQNERQLNGVLDAVSFAVKYGGVEFLVEMIKTNPDLIWTRFTNGRNLFHSAVEFRQEKIYNLLNRLDERKDYFISQVDRGRNGILHIAGFLTAPDKLRDIAGPALQFQRELQWFKEVERIVPDASKESQNSNYGTSSLTPREVFSRSHEILQKDAEKWMKDTASSNSLVATFIVTVTFAAAFTVPGGTDDHFGFPIRLKDNRFTVFIVSNIISFFASCTSALIFLGILTARYSEDDFLVSLPTKMIAGLSTLFISIAALMVAFSSALFTMLHEQSWIVNPVVLLASLPIILFVLLQYPLLAGMIISTYGKGIFDKKEKKPWW